MADTPTPDDQPTGNLEPVVSGYIVTIITLAVSAFGVDVATDGVTKAIAAFAGLVVAIASMWLTRDRVTPMAKVNAQPTTVAVANATFDLTGNTAAQQVMADLAGGETVALTSLTPAPDPLPPVPTIRPFATGLVVEPDDAGVDH